MTTCMVKGCDGELAIGLAGGVSCKTCQVGHPTPRLLRMVDALRAQVARLRETQREQFDMMVEADNEGDEFAARAIRAEAAVERLPGEVPACVTRIRELWQREDVRGETMHVKARMFSHSVAVLAEYVANTAPLAALRTTEPVDMVLRCPVCALQHIDAPAEDWDNPPHRSHLCQSCGHVWRPADVVTNGVPAVQTRGKADSALRTAPPRETTGETK